MHEHFAGEGPERVKTGETIVTRESPWDDEARGRVLRLVEFEDSIHDCGLPQSEAFTQQAFKVDHFRCYACMALAQGRRQHRTEAEREAKANRMELPEHWEEGLHYHVTLPDPSDLSPKKT